MSWLNAIENILGAGEDGVNVKSQIRMARVIRDLVNYIDVLEVTLQTVGDIAKVDIDLDALQGIAELFPDAKELL